jgi:putative DNA-invertase from lambdoid prophage Rac
MDVLAIYEETFSGATTARPEFTRMMDDAHKGRFTTVVVWALDRFGRSMIGNIQTVLELDRLGVRLVSLREPWLDTSGPVRSLLLAIFSWCAEQERLRIVERTKAGMDRARRDGKTIGRPSSSISTKLVSFVPVGSRSAKLPDSLAWGRAPSARCSRSTTTRR